MNGGITKVALELVASSWFHRRIEAASLYASGMTLKQVGGQLGISRERVRQYLGDLRIKNRKSGRSTSEAERYMILILYNQGYTSQEIQAKLKHGRTTVRRVLLGFNAVQERCSRTGIAIIRGVRHRQCCDCGGWFPERRYGTRRIYPYCGSCFGKRSVAYQKANRDAYNAYQRKYHREHRRNK